MQPAVILRAPAVRAALIQLLALACTLPRRSCCARFFPFKSIISVRRSGRARSPRHCRWRRLARWWVAIQLLFPAALLLTLALRLPPWLFLAAFLFLLLLYWSTFRTQVPFYPSGRRCLARGRSAAAGRTGADRRHRQRPGRPRAASGARRPDCDVTGIELAPLPWLVSRLRAPGGPANLRFTLGDYDGLDFAAFDVVFAYLSPAAMERLWRKAAAEMRPETLLLSYEFAIPGQPALRIVLDSNGKTLHGWRF
jgi:hypothetical protein